jgi:hypothetical protein
LPTTAGPNPPPPQTKITKLYNNPEREREREKRLGKKLVSEEELVGFFGCVFFWVFWLLRD